ncbi:MAG TPA: MATE family efflux transporter [Candidatus Mediterraneibacter norfolkensis]|nr:MATE family efflux transporter [Candidatus Mediterraneibacter norfolkensis]
MRGLIYRLTEPAGTIPDERKIFSNHDLKVLIVPLFLEQLLEVLVGVSDTFMVSYAGEAAVSGVSLVNMFNTVFIFLFSALAAGGAVVVSQYIGSRDEKNGNLSAGQLVMISAVFSAAVTVFSLALNRQLLRLLFGEVDPDVMEVCVTYLQISAYSYPAIAIYNAGAAVYRSMGKTSVTMNISLASNGINIVGNAVGVFVLHAGVAGVAYPSLIARTFSAVVILILCFRKKSGPVSVRLAWKNIFRWEGSMVKRILSIAVPNGIENGLFQLTKVALSSITALFGTVQIAANGVAQSFWSVAALMGTALGLAFVTVIGQCMGAGDTEAAEYYMKKLLRITFLASILWNALILAATPLVLKGYALSDKAADLVVVLVIIHNIFNALFYPLSGALANGLRAAGDVKYTMYVSIFSTIGCRVVFSILFGIFLDLGVIGIAFAMCLDWMIRAVFFWIRFRRGKWKEFRVIG